MAQGALQMALLRTRPLPCRPSVVAAPFKVRSGVVSLQNLTQTEVARRSHWLTSLVQYSETYAGAGGTTSAVGRVRRARRQNDPAGLAAPPYKLPDSREDLSAAYHPSITGTEYYLSSAACNCETATDFSVSLQSNQTSGRG